MVRSGGRYGLVLAGLLTCVVILIAGLSFVRSAEASGAGACRHAYSAHYHWYYYNHVNYRYGYKVYDNGRTFHKHAVSVQYLQYIGGGEHPIDGVNPPPWHKEYIYCPKH